MLYYIMTNYDIITAACDLRGTYHVIIIIYSKIILLTLLSYMHDIVIINMGLYNLFLVAVNVLD